MNRVPINKSECCGCGVCSNVCPKHSITMKPDEEGFMFPSIDESLCIDCGICLKSCAFYNRKPLRDVTDGQCYILRHKNISTRMASRSGAVFVGCSDWILSQSGSVYGAVMDGVKCYHRRAISVVERNEMCYSKYIQSDTSDIWKLVGEDLSANRKVLFSGTPCQVDALYSYLTKLKIDMTNLYTMDLICHGVPSPKLFAEFISFLERIYKGKVTDFQFRDKSICGWDDHMESFCVNGNKHASSKWRDIYYSNGIDRMSCYNCKYAAMNRPGDITFGDAWGIRKAAPDYYDNRGASVVIVNTDKGERLIEAIRDVCDMREVPVSAMLQPNLLQPSEPKVDRDKLWQDYEKGGIELLVNKYGTMPYTNRLAKKVKYNLRKIKYLFSDVYLPGTYPLNH